MDGEHGNAFRLRQPGKFRTIYGTLIPTETHLQRDWDSHGGDSGADERHGEFEIAHEVRAGVAARDLFCRAAHVDVDHRGTQILRQTRRLRHQAWGASGDLHGVGTGAAGCSLDLAGGVTKRETIRCNHFRNREACAKSLRQPAHAEIGHA